MADMKVALGVLLALGIIVVALNMASNISLQQLGYENTKVLLSTSLLAVSTCPHYGVISSLFASSHLL